jgi:hypothetical protein
MIFSAPGMGGPMPVPTSHLTQTHNPDKTTTNIGRQFIENVSRTFSLEILRWTLSSVEGTTELMHSLSSGSLCNGTQPVSFRIHIPKGIHQFCSLARYFISEDYGPTGAI